MVELKEKNMVLSELNHIIKSNSFSSFDQERGVKVGIDLGTSSFVLVVLNEFNQPVYGIVEETNVVKDGLIVDYHKSVQIVSKLKEYAETALGFSLKKASAAIPPGTIGNNKRIVSNVLESSAFEVDKLLDEPTAAANFLGIRDGAVVDVGGGTTGISIFKNGNVLICEDEPTGGSHMTLVIAGHYKLSISEAEKRKRNPRLEKDNFLICRPVIHRMAEITNEVLKKHSSDPVYIVGGASNFSEFEKEFSKYLGAKVYKPLYPELVTPFGIAMASQLYLDSR